MKRQKAGIRSWRKQNSKKGSGFRFLFYLRNLQPAIDAMDATYFCRQIEVRVNNTFATFDKVQLVKMSSEMKDYSYQHGTIGLRVENTSANFDKAYVTKYRNS